MVSVPRYKQQKDGHSIIDRLFAAIYLRITRCTGLPLLLL
jgi:hypothetical protein